MRVLAVGAHPDDLEIFCAGTLLRYIDAGHHVTMTHLCNGDKGSFTEPPEVIARTRREEAQNSAKLAGADYIAGVVPDGDLLAADPQHRDMVADLVRKARPDIILTHGPEDYMCDHNETSKLVFDASFLATQNARITAHANYERITPLFYFDAMAGVGFTPTEYVDITPTFGRKLAMFDQHVSQAPFLDEVGHAATMREQIEISARYRGVQAGVRYAEGFRACPHALRGFTQRLLP